MSPNCGTYRWASKQGGDREDERVCYESGTVHIEPHSVLRACPGAAAARRTWQAPTHTASQNCAAGLGMAREGDQTPRMPRRLSTSVRYQSANCGAGKQSGAKLGALCAVLRQETCWPPEDRQGGLNVSTKALVQGLVGEVGGLPQARLGHMG